MHNDCIYIGKYEKLNGITDWIWILARLLLWYTFFAIISIFLKSIFSHLKVDAHYITLKNVKRTKIP